MKKCQIPTTLVVIFDSNSSSNFEEFLVGFMIKYKKTRASAVPSKALKDLQCQVEKAEAMVVELLEKMENHVG